MADTLTYEKLRDYTAGEAVALRARITLQPAGGAGTKIFPPTYSGGVYASEEKGKDPDSTVDVLLDSVASQANRAEIELLRMVRARELDFPVPSVDFKGLNGHKEITALEAPHRVVDAIFRDSYLDGVLFRLTETGRSITEATLRDATAIYEHCPSALLFGMWDSTGPKGGLGSKFQRAYVSEVVGHNAEFCTGTSSRLDPLQIHGLPDDQKIYKHRDEEKGWTLDKAKAESADIGKDKDILILFGAKNKNGAWTQGEGKPSNINHGNVKPSSGKDMDGNKIPGGVTVSEATQTTVLSLAALRKLGFGDRAEEEQELMRTCIAALGVCSIVAVYRGDLDLRSRCLLVPQNRLAVEVLLRGNPEPETYDVSIDTAIGILEEAVSAADAKGCSWSGKSLSLEVGRELAELVKLSGEAAKNTE